MCCFGKGGVWLIPFATPDLTLSSVLRGHTRNALCIAATKLGSSACESECLNACTNSPSVNLVYYDDDETFESSIKFNFSQDKLVK